MKCDEVRTLAGAYADSELDARTIVEIEQHLRSCADCAAGFAKDAREDTRVRALLNRGEKTTALWEQIERRVAAAAATAASGENALTKSRRGGVGEAIAAMGERMVVGWRRSRWAWSAMAATWMVIFAIQLAAREPGATGAPAPSLPRASELRLALKQKQRLSASLAAVSEPLPHAVMKPVPHGPRSEWRNDTRNG